jgi:hypothetical protein
MIDNDKVRGAGFLPRAKVEASAIKATLLSGALDATTTKGCDKGHVALSIGGTKVFEVAIFGLGGPLDHFGKEERFGLGEAFVPLIEIRAEAF